MTKKLTTKGFILKAENVHGDTYDYSMVRYITSDTKVKIKCKDHGVFSQKPNNHLSLKQGCPKCGGTGRLTNSEFIQLAKGVHGDLYLYDDVEYINTSTKVTLKCVKHGLFKQTPRDHLQGNGCFECKGIKRLTTYDFIRKSIAKHGFTYGYGNAIYINKNTKVEITCTKHGGFLQLPGNHYNLNQGCPTCSKTGYKINKHGVVYILRSTCGEHVKIGITNNVNNRMDQLSNCTPFDFNIIHKISTTGVNAKHVEKSLHKLLVNSGFNNFNGATEWFKYNSEIINTIIEHVK